MPLFPRRLAPASLAALLLTLLLAAAPLRAQEIHAQEKSPPPKPSAAAPALQLLPADAVTHHKITVAGQEIAYTATAGTLPLRDEKGEKQADIFYVAYFRDGVSDRERRPITYAFNGGPGAASAYLNIGAIGPRTLDFGSSGMPQPTIDRVADNPDTWLPFTDLVFIDPVGTGYSRAVSEDETKKLWSVRPDLEALAQIIRLHLTRVGRLSSPVYLVGESYGGFRAARLTQLMAREQGISAAGAMLISPVIEFRLMSGGDLDLLSWALRLPSYAAVALESKGVLSPEALSEAEHFALGDYLLALASGLGTPEAQKPLYDRVAELIGLDEPTVARWRGRVPVGVYVKDRYRAEGEILSRYDGTVAVADPDPRSDRAEEDPILDGSVAPFTRAFTAYARDELGFSADLSYRVLNGDVSRHWDWREDGSGDRESLGAADALSRALSLHPHMRVLIAHGLTDLTTPYMMSRYVVDHMPSKVTANRVELKLYQGGHMMYLRSGSRHHLHDDAQAFYGGGPR